MADVQALVPLYLRSPEDGTKPYASPILAADLSGLRPAHITSAEYAMLRDDGERYVERLRQAGVPVPLSLQEGHVHDSAAFTEVMASARAWRDEVLVVLRRVHEQAAVPRS